MGDFFERDVTLTDYYLTLGKELGRDAVGGGGASKKFSWRRLDHRLPVSLMIWPARTSKIVSDHYMQMASCRVLRRQCISDYESFHMSFALFSMYDARPDPETYSKVKSRNYQKTGPTLSAMSFVFASGYSAHCI